MARRNAGSSATSAARRSRPEASDCDRGLEASQSSMGRPATSCGTRASRSAARSGTDTLTSRATSEGPAGSSTRPVRGGASARTSTNPAGSPSRTKSPRASVRPEAVAATSWASGSGWPATSSRPRTTRRARAGKSARRTSPRNAGPMFRERVPAAAQPWGSRTVSVAAPSKARNRNVPSVPVRTIWVRSPCASITCACTAPAPPGSPTLPSTIGALAAPSSAQRRRLTASVCPSQDHIARILPAAGHLGKPSIFPYDLARIRAHRPWDSDALVVPHAGGPRVVGHQRLVAAREPALEPAEVAHREPHVDHRILAHCRALADVGLATRDPGERGRPELHQPVRAPLAGHVRPEAALHRYQAKDEEGIVPGPRGLAQDCLGQLRPELRVERPGDAPEKRLQVRLTHRPRVLLLGVAGEGGRQAEKSHESARQGEPDAHGDNGDPGASRGHASPSRGPPAEPPRPWRLTTGPFERQGAEQAKCASGYGDTVWKLPVSPPCRRPPCVSSAAGEKRNPSGPPWARCGWRSPGASSRASPTRSP